MLDCSVEESAVRTDIRGFGVAESLLPFVLASTFRARPDLVIHNGPRAVQNHPDQLAELMCNRAGGLLVSQARHQTAIKNLEDASFEFDRRIRGLLENVSHSAVALRAAVALSQVGQSAARGIAVPPASFSGAGGRWD